jgi:hypothetical protein
VRHRSAWRPSRMGYHVTRDAKWYRIETLVCTLAHRCRLRVHARCADPAPMSPSQKWACGGCIALPDEAACISAYMRSQLQKKKGAAAPKGAADPKGTWTRP